MFFILCKILNESGKGHFRLEFVATILRGEVSIERIRRIIDMEYCSRLLDDIGHHILDIFEEEIGIIRIAFEIGCRRIDEDIFDGIVIVSLGNTHLILEG